jgi:hypothetical protein
MKKNKSSLKRRTIKGKKTVSKTTKRIKPKKRAVSKSAPGIKPNRKKVEKKTNPPFKLPLITALGVKQIPEVGYDFDDVIDNVEKLLNFYFPDSSKGIKEKVYRLSSKYVDYIDGEYETFLTLHNSKRELLEWTLTVVPDIEKVSPVARNILDLYYQINMVNNYDVYNDVLIYAYLKDIQPKLK